MVASLPEIHVVMAVYKPEMPALERQIASVLAQEGCSVRLHLFADGPMPQLASIKALVGLHPELSLTAMAENCGPAATFLEGLAQVLAHPAGPAAQRWFAFCDQDDVWHPDKLAASLALLQETMAGCVHSDARVVDAQLNVIAPSLFALEQREPDPGLTGLFFRNNATGMTMLFDEALARQVSALSQLRPHRWLHDHFTAFVAAAGRGLAFHGGPLADYVQHGGNAVGAGRRGFAWPKGGFVDPRGDAARLLASGHDLVSALLTEADLADPVRMELEQLRRLLAKGGLASLPQTLRTLRRTRGVPRGLYARLVWSKVAW